MPAVGCVVAAAVNDAVDKLDDAFLGESGDASAGECVDLAAEDSAERRLESADVAADASADEAADASADEAADASADEAADGDESVDEGADGDESGDEGASGDESADEDFDKGTEEVISLLLAELFERPATQFIPIMPEPAGLQHLNRIFALSFAEPQKPCGII